MTTLHCRLTIIRSALLILFGCETDTPSVAIKHDEKTGLMWVQYSPGGFNWQDANTYCTELSADDHTQWRLPSIRELEDIDSDAATLFPDIGNKNHYTAVYWSITPKDHHEPPDFYYTWDFDNHRSQAYFKTTRKQVTCVSTISGEE